MNKKAKILIFIALLILIQVLNGAVQSPFGIYDLYVFAYGIWQYWAENLEKLIGPIIGFFSFLEVIK